MISTHLCAYTDQQLFKSLVMCSIPHSVYVRTYIHMHLQTDTKLLNYLHQLILARELEKENGLNFLKYVQHHACRLGLSVLAYEYTQVTASLADESDRL